MEYAILNKNTGSFRPMKNSETVILAGVDVSVLTQAKKKVDKAFFAGNKDSFPDRFQDFLPGGQTNAAHFFRLQTQG